IRKVWNVGVPFKQRRDTTRQILSQLVETPDNRRHRLIVRIDQVLTTVGRACKMDLHDARVRQVTNVMLGIEPMVVTGYINIVHIQQQTAAGLPRQLRKKVPLGDRRLFEFQIRRRVLQNQRALEKILNLSYTLADVRQTL